VYVFRGAMLPLLMSMCMYWGVNVASDHVNVYPLGGINVASVHFQVHVLGDGGLMLPLFISICVR